jgi:hypothetical protein
VTPGSLVTIQTGTGLTVKSVARPTTTTTAKKRHSTTTTLVTTTTVFDPPGVKSNNSFSAPSLVNQALEPYDPRACNAADTGPVASTTAK